MQRHLSNSQRARAAGGELYGMKTKLLLSDIPTPESQVCSISWLIGKPPLSVLLPTGTTRDVIEVAMDLGGVKCIVSDTTGVIEDGTMGDGIELEGIKRAVLVAADSHYLVCVVDIQKQQTAMTKNTP